MMRNEMSKEKENQKPKRHVYRLPPCPAYDIEGMESYLADMAKEGLLLIEDGFFGGIATFERTTPMKVRYRLEAARKSTSMWSENNGDPEAEEVELYEKYGWEYIAKRGSFYIYRTFDPDARELNTDSAVQDIVLKAIYKRQLANVVISLIWLALYPFLYLRGYIIGAMLAMGTGFFLFNAIVLFDLMFLRSFIQFVRLGKLRKRLQREGILDHSKNWRRSKAGYRVTGIVRTCAVILWIILWAKLWSDDVMGVGEIPIEEFAGTLPFATMADFVPDGTYVHENLFDMDVIKEDSDWIAPCFVEWMEHGRIHCPDGSTVQGGLNIDYYEMKTPWLAKQLAQELLRQDKKSKYYEELPATSIETINADFIAVYRNQLHFPTIILQEGSKVLHAYFYQIGESKELTLEEWTSVLWDSIRGAGLNQ